MTQVKGKEESAYTCNAMQSIHDWDKVFKSHAPPVHYFTVTDNYLNGKHAK